MTEDKKAKTYKLEGETLQMATQWNVLLKQFMVEKETLKAELEARNKAINDAYNSKLKELWGSIVARLGLTPEDTWSNPDWGLDLKYLDEHGDAYVVFVPTPDNVLDSLFGHTRHEEPPASRPHAVDPSKLN